MKITKFVRTTLVVSVILCLILGIRISFDSSGEWMKLRLKPQIEAKAFDGLGWPQNTIAYWPDTISNSDGCIADVETMMITNTCTLGLWSCTESITVGGTTFASGWVCFDPI